MYGPCAMCAGPAVQACFKCSSPISRLMYFVCMAGGCISAIGAFTQHTHEKKTETRRIEFAAGYVGHSFRVITIARCNLDNYWTVVFQLNAIQGMLPCQDSTCTHPIRRVEFGEHGGFVLQRACPAFGRARTCFWRGVHAEQRFPQNMSNSGHKLREGGGLLIPPSL